MCKEPSELPDGTKVVCRKCEQCLGNRINDWVGRNIAESKVSDQSFAVTLTYGRNEANEKIHERTVALTYSDFQKYLKLLRRHGYNVRYFVTGEYGSLNGRAHWHALLYFTGGHPYYENRNPTFMEEHWPHGYSFWDAKPSYGAARYACKYILKNTDDAGAQTFGPMPSKKPPLGMTYFEQLAERYVKDGLSPQSLEYSFPDVRFTKKDGTREFVKFWLRDRTAELFLDHFLLKWKEAYQDLEPPKSELVELYVEYGRVVKNEQAMLTRKEFPRGEGIWRPLPTSDEIRASVEEAERRKAEYAVKRMNHDQYIWYQNWIREAPNGEEKEKRQQEFEHWQNDSDAKNYESIARYISKRDGITREIFDAYVEQYNHESGDCDTCFLASCVTFAV